MLPVLEPCKSVYQECQVLIFRFDCVKEVVWSSLVLLLNIPLSELLVPSRAHLVEVPSLVSSHKQFVRILSDA